MKLLFKLLAVLIVLFFTAPLLLPGDFQVKRSKVISHNSEDTFDYIVNLENWKNWNPWLEEEPTADFIFDGIPGVVGSKIRWKGEKIGEGQMTLTSLATSKKINMDLLFKSPYPSEAKAYFDIKESGTSTEVTWGFSTKLSYMSRYQSLFMGPIMKEAYDRGLNNLERELNKLN